jgi:hypothetical protein
MAQRIHECDGLPRETALQDGLGVIEPDAASGYFANWLLYGQRHDRPAGAPSPASTTRAVPLADQLVSGSMQGLHVELILVLRFDKAHRLV